MVVLKEGIETNPRNFTRFVVISRNESLPGHPNKSSLIYSVSDKPGALFETLRIFAQNDINIVKLESRPIHSRPWEYMFYVDLETDVTEEGRTNILDELRKRPSFSSSWEAIIKAPGRASRKAIRNQNEEISNFGASQWIC